MGHDAEVVVRVRLPDSGFRPDVEVAALHSVLDIRVGGSRSAPVLHTIPLPGEGRDCNLVVALHDGVLEVKVPVSGEEPQNPEKVA